MKSKIILSLAIALTAALLSQPMFADITYEYTGNPFTNALAPYTTSDKVTGSVTLAAPLAPNLSQLTPVSAIAFTFSDGVQTITNCGPLDPGSVTPAFATDLTGAITGWEVVLVTDLGIIVTTNRQLPLPRVADTGQVLGQLPGLHQGRIDGAPGLWSTAASVADAGSTLSLMTLTLMALGVSARRFQPISREPRGRLS